MATKRKRTRPAGAGTRAAPSSTKRPKGEQPQATRGLSLPVVGTQAGAHLHPHDGKYELCAYCPKMCRFSCPVAEADARESLTPWGKMSAPFLATRPTPEVSLEAAFETSWGCTGCGHCVEYCTHDNDVPTALAAVRAAGVAAGLPSPVTERIRSAFAKSGNPAGKSQAAFLKSKIPAALRDQGSSQVLLMTGCSTGAAEPDGLKRAVAIVERLGGRGVSLSIDDQCCGASLWWAGLPDEFDAHAERFARTVAGRKKLVLADAGCAWALKVLYPRRGHRLAPEVLHVSEWLAAFFRERVFKARQRIEGKFIYHDPCTLARDLEVVDEPRAVLAAILVDGAREFAWNRRDTTCCGGGGLLPLSMPATSARMAEHRVTEARQSGATIVTSCASCLRQFRSAGARADDLLTLVARAL